MREVSVGGRNRIAMRIELGMAQHRVDAFDQPIGDDVLHLLGVFMNFVPVHAHDLDEEQLDQAMTTDDAGPWTPAPLTARRCRAHASSLTPQRLDHRGRGARRNAERGRQLTIGTSFWPATKWVSDVNRLQVILDGARRKHCPCNILAKVR